MLKVMVATTDLATIVSFSWIGVLALVLVARAVTSWLAFRSATRSAARAKEIAEATALPPSQRSPEPGLAPVVPFVRRSTAPRSRPKAAGG